MAEMGPNLPELRPRFDAIGKAEIACPLGVSLSIHDAGVAGREFRTLALGRG